MRAGSNSQAGKAVVDSNLDLAGLGYFYFPKSHRGREVEGGEFMCVGDWGGRKSFYKCQTMTSDQLHPHKQSRKETHRSPSHQPAQDGVSGREDGWAREGRRRWRREGTRVGNYTIIQITAGYNLVADVSRSTMPTTHRSACVCVCVLTEFQYPASKPLKE